MEKTAKTSGTRKKKKSVSEWKSLVAEFQKPHAGRAWWQVINSVGSVGLIWCILYFLQGMMKEGTVATTAGWWATVSLSALAGLFLVRVFIIFHDCGHGSFLKSKKANNTLGFISGLLTLTPFHHWKWEHSIHHASTGDLSRRGVGDIWTLTVKEYLESTRWRRFTYRLTRNPVILFLIAPLFLFFVLQRFVAKSAKPRERKSVHLMNMALLIKSAVLISIFGFFPWFIIQLIMMTVAGTCGVWLFYVQHQFEDAYWVKGDEWDFTTAAMEGSSFYKLPKLLQWFSGNIGFHHVHHLNPMIPNYNLERCHCSDPYFEKVPPMNILTSLKSINYRLWDEEANKMIGFRELKHQLASRELDQAA
jgi:omega-6 fatty acid desaturase (delta-12 desaturase)